MDLVSDPSLFLISPWDARRCSLDLDTIAAAWKRVRKGLSFSSNCNWCSCLFGWCLQLLLTEEKDKERPANVEDDEDGHLIYSNNDIIRKQCQHFSTDRHCHSTICYLEFSPMPLQCSNVIAVYAGPARPIRHVMLQIAWTDVTS